MNSKRKFVIYYFIFIKAVEIWLEYIQFSIGGMGEPNGIENVRKICEEAISLTGLHVTKGYLLWEAYREFESAILSGLEVSNLYFISQFDIN